MPFLEVSLLETWLGLQRCWDGSLVSMIVVVVSACVPISAEVSLLAQRCEGHAGGKVILSVRLGSKWSSYWCSAQCDRRGVAPYI